MNYIKHYIRFIKERYSLFKAHHHARDMCVWNKVITEQRKAWYLSDEARTIVLEGGSEDVSPNKQQSNKYSSN